MFSILTLTLNLVHQLNDYYKCHDGFSFPIALLKKKTLHRPPFAAAVAGKVREEEEALLDINVTIQYALL